MHTSYRTHSHELGRFGQGSVDLQCGNLMFESEDFAWSGNRMPVTIKHLFNSALAGYSYTNTPSIHLTTADFSAMKVGHGFKLNIMQSMVATSFVHEDTSYSGYVYVGENGEETYFKKSEKQTCCDSNSQCYSLFEDVNGGDMLYDPVKRELTQGDDIYQFDTSGRLIKITDAPQNHMDITYTSNRITSVTDGAGRSFVFGYNSNGQLISITAPDETSITYGYTNNLLTSVVYPDNKKAVIAYTLNNPSSVTLQDVCGNQLYRVNYIYFRNRLLSVTEYGSDGSVGAKSSYSYSVAASRTLVSTSEQKDAEEGEKTNNVITTTYTFDDDGNITSEYVYSTDTGKVGGEGEQSGINPLSGERGTGIVCNINNLLRAHGFESLNAWLSMPGNCEDLHIDNDVREAKAKYGTRLLHMISSNRDATENGVYQVTNSLPKGQYAFSVYVQAFPELTALASPCAYIRVTTTNGTVLSESERICEADGTFTRLFAPFELTAEQSVRVELLLDGKCEAYMDAAQLENNPYPNAYNMLANGNFERGLTDWTNCTSGVSYTTSTRFNMKNALQITGSISSKRYACQSVPVHTTDNTRETFTLSGWARGYALPNHERVDVEDPTFRLRAELVYNDSTVEPENFYADFSPCTEDWQPASVQFCKTKRLKVDAVRVYCEYSYNSGTAYFDDIQLVRDSLETDLTAEDFLNDNDSNTADSENSTEDTTPGFEEAKDAYGNLLTETTFDDDEYGTIYRSFKFNDADNCMSGDDAGNNLVEETDARGNKTTYTVDGDTSRNEEVIDRLGNKTAYEYDNSGRTTKVTSKDANDTELAHVSYSYDAFDNMTRIARGDGMKYALAYNEFHNLASIGIEGKSEPLIKYTYKNGNGRLKRMTYANGHTMKAIYNSIGQMVAEKWFATETEATDSTASPIAHYKYVYDGQGNIVRSIDITGRKEYNYEYEEGRIVRATEADLELNGEAIIGKTIVNAIKYHYDTKGKLVKEATTFPDHFTHTVDYTTSDDNNSALKITASGHTVTAHAKTDAFGRKLFDELQLSTSYLTRQFSYHEGSITQEHRDHEKVKSAPTTQLVSQIAISDGRTISYEYDAEERITRVTDSVDGVTEYTYDALGQLLTETVNGEVVNSMEYDNYGNIVKKNGKTYTYGNATWKDLLTGFDGKTIEYDAQGNPTNYLGHTLTWEKGRQLKSFDCNTYTYNANGIRTSKTVNGVLHTYTLDGTKILREAWNGSTLVPLYDTEDAVCGILYNHIPYYFIKNLQGDIITIVDKDAKTVARYTYDAWGVPTITHDSSDCNIATINPFRYRSYYFDQEIALYYLQSRYYDASVGRFTSVDDPTIINNASNTASVSTNKYCYCQNSPSNDTDECGSIPGAIVKMIGNFLWGMAGGMLGLYLANVTLNIANGKKNFYAKNDSWGTYIAEGVKSGAFAIFGSKLAYKIIAVIGASVLKQFVDMLIYKSSFNFWGLLTDIIVGILFVIVVHFGPTVLEKLSSKKKESSSKWIAKLKDIVKKIADYLIDKLRKTIDKLVSFFKNTFVKRFSISYAKRIGIELKKIFA